MEKLKNLPLGTQLFLGSLVILVMTTLPWLLVPNITISSWLELRPWLLWFFAGAAYIILSFRFEKPITAEEIGVRTFFGKPLDQLGPGLPLAPRGLFDITRLPNLTVQNEWPTEPEMVFRGAENQSPPPGQKPPIRITFREAVTEDEARDLLGSYFDVETVDDEKGTTKQISFKVNVPDDGLNKRVTAEVTAVTKYRIIDGVKYVQTIGDKDRAAQQIEDVVVSVLQRFLPLMSVGQALQNIDWISSILHTAVEIRTKGWGIELEKPKGAYVKTIGFHRGLNEAIAKPAEADFMARATVRASEGKREEIINVGRGTAQAAADLERGTLEGRAEGLRVMAEKLNTPEQPVSGSEVLAAETARSFGENGNTAIVDPKTGLAGLAGLASSLFNKSQRPSPAASAAGTPGPATPPAPPSNGGNS